MTNVASGLRVAETPTEKCDAFGEVTHAECKKFKADSKDFQDKISKAKVGKVDLFDLAYVGLPTGCQFYIDPANPSYNRFLYNAVNGPDRDNERNGATDGSGWLSKSYSLRVCENPRRLGTTATGIATNAIDSAKKVKDGCKDDSPCGCNGESPCVKQIPQYKQNWYKTACNVNPSPWNSLPCAMITIQDLGKCCDMY